MTSLPFDSIGDNEMIKTINNDMNNTNSGINNYKYGKDTNNDFLAKLDPDINVIDTSNVVTIVHSSCRLLVATLMLPLPLEKCVMCIVCGYIQLYVIAYIILAT